MTMLLTVDSELLPHDVVELIFECLPVKSLLKFKCVSKNCKSTIESRRFQEKHFTHRRSRDPDVLFVRLFCPFSVDGDSYSFEFGSSVASTFSLPTLGTGNTICYGSCDGLLCLYNLYAPSTPNLVVNPATGWHRTFPLSTLQQILVDLCKRRQTAMVPLPELGFGKDKFKGTYKAVFLYNSLRLSQDNTATTCEVFDFSTNAWRYLLPASPYRIASIQKPVYFDGSLYWLTECEETKVLSLDLHTETFQVISTAPFPPAPKPRKARDITISVLDNRLCVSHKEWPTQVIWCFDSSSGTWNEMWSIDFTNTFEWFKGEPKGALVPIAILEKNKLLLQGRDSFGPVVMHDRLTKSCNLLFKSDRPLASVCYFESLLSL